MSALVVVAAPLINASPAHADEVPANNIPVAAAGSDTTEGMMNSITFDVNHHTDNVTDTGYPVTGVTGGYTTARAYNIPAFSSTTYHVPGYPGAAADCNHGIDWTKDPAAPTGNTALATGQEGLSPFGSGAGRNYLKTENTGTGPNPASGTTAANTNFSCISVARSSSFSSGAPATNQFYAYALDGVSWATTSSKAPPSLSVDQIQKIYNCTFTDWSQVGGSPGSIVRYFPQAGSGTRAFFTSAFLNNVTPDDSPAGCSATGDRHLRQIEENQINGKGNQEAQGVKAADLDKAILVYSGALFSFQTTNNLNPTLNKSCVVGVCARMGAVSPVGDTTPANGQSVMFWNGTDRSYELDGARVNEANELNTHPTPAFPGIRYLYNVLDKVGPRPGYQAAKQLFGFDNVPSGALSPLCDNSAAGHSGSGGDLWSQIYSDILSQGFLPLDHTSSSANLAGGSCRISGPGA